MQNIDLIYLAQPLVVTAVAVLLVLYWRKRRSLTWWVLLYSLAAYAIAIIAKTVFQLFTASAVASTGSLAAMGAYLGLQTVALEVGLAYAFARVAISKGRMSRKDASGYGIGLAFWENGVLLGALSAVNLAALYLTLGAGGAAASAAFASVSSTQPALLYSASQALPSVLLGMLERMSSVMLHAAWGFLAFLAAFYKRRRYLFAALPMGLVDSLVVLSGVIGTAPLEALIFAVALASVAVAWWASRDAGRARA